MAKKSKKVVPYRRPKNFNVGIIIFAIIFVYLVFSVYLYVRKEKIQFYEVVEGSIISDKEYSGIILRQEEMHYTERAGNINYYIREGKRASVGMNVYSIDESGKMAAFLKENQDAAIGLSDENLIEVKKQLSTFSMGFEENRFDAVYDLQYTLDAAVLGYVSFNTMLGLDAMHEELGIHFQQVGSDRTGIISYAIDNYESLQPYDVDESSFDRNNYSRTIIKSGDLIASGVPVYKIITSEDWSVMFPLSADDAAEYRERDELTVKFTDANLEVKGKFSIMTGKDGGLYGKLDFNQYMVQFVSDRFVNIEIVSEKIEGLKIPVSAVTTKEFYVIPIEYLAQGGDSSDSGFLKEFYSETGAYVQFIPTELYNSNEMFYYVNKDENGEFLTGDYLVKPDSTDRYQIGQTATLQGVYNINKGYTLFKQIDILKSNEEYYTVRKGMRYGLTVYDHIVLNADTTYEGALIYR